MTNITWNHEHEFTIPYNEKEKLKKKQRQFQPLTLMNGNIQEVLSWWAGILQFACKQLAFVLQFSYGTHSLRDRSATSTYEPCSATNFLLVSCLLVLRQKSGGKEHVSRSFSFLRVCLSSIDYVLGLTWLEVLTVEELGFCMRYGLSVCVSQSAKDDLIPPYKKGKERGHALSWLCSFV